MDNIETKELLETIQRDIFDIRLMLKGLKKEEWLFQRLDVFVKKNIPISNRQKAWADLELIKKEYFDSTFIKNSRGKKSLRFPSKANREV